MFDGIYCYEEDESPLPKGAALSPVEFGTSGYVPADQAEMEHLDLDGIGEELNDEDTAADQQSEPTTPAVITTTTLKEVHENQTCFDCKCDVCDMLCLSTFALFCLESSVGKCELYCISVWIMRQYSVRKLY